jgi:type IV pilus assembly protein PilW
VPSLYRAVFDEAGTALAEELVEGVENMQVTYGVDTNGDGRADNYQTAALVADWNTVQTVRIGLLLATSYSTTSQTEQRQDTTPFYDIGGMAQIAVQPDNRRRRVVVETVKIRNRPIVRE